MTNLPEYPTATLESVWAAFRESDLQRKENERILNEKFAETDKQIKETGKQIKETEKQIKETDRHLKELSAELDRRIKKNEETMGSWSNNQGAFAEEYFFNSFENGKQNFFGEKFDEIEKNVKGFKKGFKDEYDILLINGKSVGIIEVKFKAHKNDIPKVIKKAETFRENFPYYANHQIYLGLATMAFYPDLEQECFNQGIAVVKQLGETVVINDTHLKVF